METSHLSFLSSLILILSLSTLTIRPSESLKIGHNKYNNKRDQANAVYLLISTSSKLYCMRMPELSTLLNPRYHHDLRNYEVIYEEKAHAQNWITDAFYVKSENLIYVNVYNSSSASSDIFTLRWDSSRSQWVKTMLFEDQAYCLGIAYNEDRRELYWTAAKSILSGSSLLTGGNAPREFKNIFNLDLAKKVDMLQI